MSTIKNNHLVKKANSQSVSCPEMESTSMMSKFVKKNTVNLNGRTVNKNVSSKRKRHVAKLGKGVTAYSMQTAQTFEERQGTPQNFDWKHHDDIYPDRVGLTKILFILEDDWSYPLSVGCNKFVLHRKKLHDQLYDSKPNYTARQLERINFVFGPQVTNGVMADDVKEKKFWRKVGSDQNFRDFMVNFKGSYFNHVVYDPRWTSSIYYHMMGMYMEPQSPVFMTVCISTIAAPACMTDAITLAITS